MGLLSEALVTGKHIQNYQAAREFLLSAKKFMVKEAKAANKKVHSNPNTGTTAKEKININDLPYWKAISCSTVISST